MSARVVSSLLDVMSREQLRLCIAYDEFAAGLEAKGVCEGFIVRFAPSTVVHHSIWKSSILAIPSMFELAVHDAVEADVLIVAIQAEVLPEHLLRWLSTWQASEHQASALIALFDGVHQLRTEPHPAAADLQRMAHLARVDYLSSHDINRLELETTLSRLHHRSEAHTHVLDDILHHQDAPPKSLLMTPQSR